MSGMACDTTHLLLQAELDGELDAAGAANLSGHVEACPACAALRAELATLSSELRTGLTRHAAPPALRAMFPARAADANGRRDRPWRAGWSHAGSFGAGLAVAAGLALAMLPGSADRIPELVTAHVRALQSDHLLDVASTDRHTVKPWFDGRLDFSPAVPDLAAQGFPLVGGRLDYVDGRPVAALIYRRDKHVIDVFVSPTAQPGPASSIQGYNIVGWRMNAMGFQAVSDLNMAELTAFVRSMQAFQP